MLPAPTIAPFYYAYVGCRTSRERNARGDGLRVYRVATATGAWQPVQLVPDLVNPSFLAFGPNKRHLYTIHGDGSDVTSFTVDDQTGHLTQLNRQSTEGRNPVHLAFDPAYRFLVISNHATSTLAVLPVTADGALHPVCDLAAVTGPIGPHRVEQQIAKPHQNAFTPDGRFIIVPDKGLDQVFTFHLTEDGKLIAADPPGVRARSGSGPRHVAFHPSGVYAYVVNELDSTITAYHYRRADGRLTPLQVIPILPQSFTGDSTAAEIEVSADGRFVYASNRGSDSIAALAIDQTTGWLTCVEIVPSEGKTPRFFALSPDGRFLFVANEDSDSIVTFKVDRDTGKITPTEHRVETGSPVCIVFGD
jgi:6-phosphogluconolactonase